MSARLSILLCLAVSCSVGGSADATLYSILSPEQVSERTDVWVRGRVISWVGPVVGEDTFDLAKIRDVTLTLEVLDATDPDVPETVVVRSKTTFSTDLPVGSEVIVALSKKGEIWEPYGSLGLQGWYPMNKAYRESRGMNAHFSPRMFWCWLRDISYVIDSEGATTLKADERWLSALSKDDPTLVKFACEYFALLADAPIDSESIATAYARVYDAAAKRIERKKDDPYNESIYNLKNRFGALTRVIGPAVSNVGPNGGQRYSWTCWSGRGRTPR